MQLSYWVVDAFTDRVFAGNPAAVVLLESPLPVSLMRSIAAENNLSETAFAVKGADQWQLRWFTPTVEVDLCGHATLATAFVMRLQGIEPPYQFRTRSGLLSAEAQDNLIVLDFPARPHKEIAAPAGLMEALRDAPVAVLQSADMVAVLRSAEAVREVRPDIDRIARLPGGALIVTAAGGRGGADITSRYFAPRYGIAEDPVTGSLHTQVVPYWARVLGRTSLQCHQASPRGGMMQCELRADRVRMAGAGALYASGTIHLPG